MMTFDPAPKIASIASRLSVFAASTTALPASSGEANIFGTACDCVSAGFCCLLHDANEKTIPMIASPTDHFVMLILFTDIVILRSLPRSITHLPYRLNPPPRNPPPPKPPMRPPPHPPPP